LRTHPISIPTALAVVAALALTACTSGPAAGDRDTAEADTATADARTPFSAYWDAMYGVYDDDAEIADRERVERLVADCMAAEGFDYIPVDQHPPKAVTPYMDGYGTEDWAAAHGYGAFPTDEETRQMDEQVASEDPNQDYVDSLSESEQGAYYAALESPGPDNDALLKMKNGEMPAYDWEASGCRGRSQHAVTGDDPTQSERYAPLVAAMNALQQDQAADPAMVPIEAAWADCMADAGYADLPTRQSAVDSVFDQSTRYWDSGNSDEPSDALRDDWRDYEIEVAVADFRCGEAVDYDAKALVVQTARENRFIDDNRAELDEMLAEIAQGG